jgi:hypothetical protein
MLTVVVPAEDTTGEIHGKPKQASGIGMAPTVIAVVTADPSA